MFPITTWERVDMVPAQQERVRELIDLKRLDEAANICRKTIELSPYDWNAHYLLGIVCRWREDFKSALLCYHKSIRCGGPIAPLLRACGIAHQQLKEYPEAISAFSDSLRDEPDSIEGLNSLGLTFKKMGFYYHGIRHYCLALEQCSKRAWEKLKHEGHLKDATDNDGVPGTLLVDDWVGAYISAISQTPYFTILENIGATFKTMGNLERAEYFFDLADSKAPFEDDAMMKLRLEAEKGVLANPYPRR